MARTFSITRPQDSIVLDVNGMGKIPFTITNVTSRPIKSRVEVRPDNPQDGAMFQIEGGLERTFQPKETQTLNVLIAAPKSCEPGNHKFLLKIVDVDLPDENYEESQSVSFMVAPRQEKKFPWWIVAAAVVLIGCAGLVWYMLSNRGVVVADYTGQPYAEVSATLQKNGLVAEKGDEIPSTQQASGAVIDQSIKNQRVKEGTKVTFIVSAQRFRVRRMKGLMLEEAKTRLSDDGFIVAKAIAVTNQQSDNPAEVGRVIAQTPDPDTDPAVTEVASGPIKLTVAVPREMADLQTFAGRMHCDAVNGISSAGFNPVEVPIPSPLPAGFVMWQTPQAGRYPKGSPVTLGVAGLNNPPCYKVGTVLERFRSRAYAINK